MLEALLMILQTPQQGTSFGGLGRFEELQFAPKDGCVPPEVRQEIRRQLQQASGSYGPSTYGGNRSGNLLYPFFPMAGNQSQDIHIGGFVDLDPAPVTSHGFECGVLTRDGHDGIDSSIRSFDEQILGVPIFSALDGTVLLVRDGFPDMNLNGSTDPGNYIAIDHGSGRVAEHFHLKMNSTAVTVGQQIRAGHQIGLAASSGNSYYPHLHFGTYDNSINYEPFAGACRPGPSGWLQQPQVAHSFGFLDCAVTWQDLWQAQPLPWSQPRDGDFAVTDGLVYFWYLARGLPPNSVWRHIFERPDGTIAEDSGDLAMGNASEVQWFHGFWNYWIPDMHTITGTWHWRHIVNGVEYLRAPIEVVDQRMPGFNRPPLPAQVDLEPQAPTVNDAVLCRVESDPGLDDPDYDILTYLYSWTVDGQVVRSVEHAGQMDVLPAGNAVSGQSVQCTVVISDGMAQSGPFLDVVVVDGSLLELDAPVPGLITATNDWQVRGATPGSTVYFAWSLAAGLTPVPGCPGLFSSLANAQIGGIQTANAAGEATFRAFVPAQASGITVHFQAGDRIACELSNLLTYPFP